MKFAAGDTILTDEVALPVVQYSTLIMRAGYRRRSRSAVTCFR